MANSESVLGKFLIVCLFAAMMYTMPERNDRIQEIIF